MKKLIVYVRDFCPDVWRTRTFLKKHRVPHREIDADEDPAARARVIDWTGHLSFPTLVVAEGEAVEPFAPPAPLALGQSPRDVDRGTLITEANDELLTKFLKRHGFLGAESVKREA